MIHIKLNGEMRELDNDLSVDTVLGRLSLPQKRIAVELNGEVLGRAKWSETLLHDGDRMEIVHFVGGG